MNEGDKFWISAGSSIYEMTPAGNNFTSKSLPVNLHTQTNDLLITDTALYVATAQGLYARGRNDYHFQRSFFASDDLARQCTSIVVHDGKLLLGTRKGLLIKDENAASWHVLAGELSNAAIKSLFLYHGAVYVLTSQAVYAIDSTRQTVGKIFSIGTTGALEDEEVASDEDAQVASGSETMLDFKSAESAIYLATQKGVYRSTDGGENWEQLPNDNLPFTSLRRLLVTRDKPHRLLAATSQGVFRYEDGRWSQLYQGLESNDIFDLAEDASGRILAATSRGLFRLELKTETPAPVATASTSTAKPGFSDYTQIEEYFRNEPTIADVQAMAIEYAEVHPDKIKQWRKQARRRALAPNFSAGVNRSATDLLHWDTGTNPDSLIRGKEYLDWDAGLSWNLGDLIWNNDQTSIDSRSKLMVELREDVLDQVTRIYFERRRLQVEIISADLSPQQKIEQQMRLAELTAIIDGFTGGRFSRAMNSRGKIEV